MTKAEYMSSLQERLENFGKELQDEILEDYRQYFAEGEKQGRTEEEIIEELGNVEDMVRELAEVDRHRHRDSREIETEKSCTYTGEFKRIELSGEAADILLEPSEDERILVDYKNNGSEEDQLRYSFYQYERDGVFYAGVKRNDLWESQKIKLFGKIMLAYQNQFFNNRGGAIVLKVKVPKGIPEVSASTASGDIRACGLNAGLFHGNTLSGDITVSGVGLEEIQADSASGDIDISGIELDKIRANSSSGNIDVSDARLKTGSLNTSSGDINLRDCQSGELACGTGSGDIALQAEITNCRCSTGSGDMELRVNAPEKIVCATGSGDMELYIEDVDGVEFKVSKGSGEVEVFRYGEESRKIGGGTYSYGNGACKVKVSVGAGDIKLHI